MTDVDYESPPVIETVLGVQFEPLPGMHNGHLGAFWKALPAEWSTVTDAPALEPQLETFTDAPNWGAMSIQFRLMQAPTNRLRIRNVSGDRMIQVQNGRLHLNWLGHDGKEYPRYLRMRDEFSHTLDQLQMFLEKEDIGKIRPNQWEITYINRIECGTVWVVPSEWSFFRPIGESVRLSTAELESFGGEWHYKMENQRGRLHVQFQHVRPSDAAKVEAVIITLTARGSVDESRPEAAWSDGLDLGHQTIVTSFKELMAEEANKHWGLKHGDG